MKVKVRIAVAVDPSGDWNSAGWASGDDSEKMSLACDVLSNGEARYWIEAELDASVVKVVNATVMPNITLTGSAQLNTLPKE